MVHVGQYDWEVVYDAEAYIDLLETFSGHISMEPWQRERLYAEIRQRAGGAARRAAYAATGAPCSTSPGGSPLDRVREPADERGQRLPPDPLLLA